MSDNKDDENLGSFYMGRMRPSAEPERVLPRGLLTVVAVLIFAVVVWAAWPQGDGGYGNAEVPLIKADATVYKSAPEDPGGMEVRHQDSTVFNTIEGKTTEQVEKIVPHVEKPLDKDKLVLESAKLNLDKKMSKPVATINLGVGAQAKPKETPKTEEKPVEKVADKPTEKPAEKAPEKKEEEKPAPKAAPVTGDKYIQLGSFRDPAGAKKQWSGLKSKNADLFKGVDMRTARVDLGAKGVFHRLQVGPFDVARAAEVCAALKSGGMGCFVVK
ncbi:MAG: SPOR domain-containing protein [Alphaproteobacteria bacterium]|nr:SPOR domain-containing protein [Alphaproteobacteria bacterium]